MPRKTRSSRDIPEDGLEIRPVSTIDLGDGRYAEQVLTREGPKFLVYDPDPETYPTERYINGVGERFVPLHIDPKMLGALTIPEGIVPYTSVQQILTDAEKLALEVYDPVDELPMFRLILRLGVASWIIGLLYPHVGRERYAPIIQTIGLPENGKGRFLTVCRAIFYRSLYLSKTVRVPSLFRAIEPWGGTLILDEADLDRSTESAELVEFLNGRAYGNLNSGEMSHLQI